MSSLRDDELERILHPVRNENYMEEYAKHHVDIVRTLIGEVEAGVDGRVAESDYWSEMNRLQHWLTDQRGSVEWWTLTEGDTIRMCTDDDPLPFFTSPEHEEILCNRYGISRSYATLPGMFKEVFLTERTVNYDPDIHNHTTVPQITREEYNNILEREHKHGFTQIISEATGMSLPEAQAVLDSRRLLGYLSVDDKDVAPRVVLFAYDENWNLIHDDSVFNGYTSQTLFVPFTKDHEAYDHAIEDLKEDMASRAGLTLREGWPRP